MTNKCPVCSTNSTSPDSVTCLSCQFTFHPACVQLLPSDLDYIRDVCKKWQCSACLQTGRKHRSGSVTSGSSKQQTPNSQQPAMEDHFNRLFSELSGIKTLQQTMGEDISRIKDSQARLREEINSKCNQLQDELVACNTRLADHDVALSEHSGAIREINEKLQKIEAEIIRTNTGPYSTGDSNPPGRTVSDIGWDRNIDDIVAEFGERQKRASNVIIFGAPESRNGSGGERKIADELFVNQIFSYLGVSAEISDVSRIGRVAGDKVRPLKITLQSEAQVKAVLGNVKKLRDNDSYTNVRVSLDRTPMQQQRYRIVKTQLAERLANGERDLRIRFVSGVPTIVSLN